MANLFLGSPNDADEAALSGGAWQSTLPLANLQKRGSGAVARSLTTTLTSFDVALAASRRVRALALIHHNLSLDATYRIYAAGTADFSSPVYDSGALEVWPVGIYDPLNLEWEDANFWAAQISDDVRAAYPGILIHYPPQTVGRYWRVVMTDAANPNGYIQVGRLFIGGGWQPAVNYDYGASLGLETTTRVEESLGDVEYFDRHPVRRVFRFTLSWLDHSAAYQQAFDFQRRVGIDQEVLLVADPDDLQNGIRRNYLGRLRQLSPIEHPYFDYHQTGFEIQETL